MAVSAPTLTTKPLDVVICIDDEVYSRYRAVLQHLCVGLIDHAASVRVVSSTPRAESLSLGPIQAVIHPPLRWPWVGRRLQELAETLAIRPPSVIHTFSGRAYPLAEWLAEEFDADLVYQCHGLDDIEALRQRAYTGPRVVIATTDPLVERVAQLTAFNREEIDLVRLGVSGAQEPTCFAAPERSPTVLASAALVAESRLDVLLHAVAALHKGGQKFLTFLVGSGPEEGRLRELVRELGLTAQVIIAMPAGDPTRALTGADIFVQPTPERAVSGRVLHALAQGIAVAAVAGGVNDVYWPGVTAQVAPAGTVVDLAAAMERLLLDHAYARKLAAGAIAYMRKHHGMSAMAEATAAVYRRLAFQRATYRLER
jgi:glycosyltransferase involved in cell wall biosynthesis